MASFSECFDVKLNVSSLVCMVTEYKCSQRHAHNSNIAWHSETNIHKAEKIVTFNIYDIIYEYIPLNQSRLMRIKRVTTQKQRKKAAIRMNIGIGDGWLRATTILKQQKSSAVSIPSGTANAIWTENFCRGRLEANFIIRLFMSNIWCFVYAEMCLIKLFSSVAPGQFLFMTRSPHRRSRKRLINQSLQILNEPYNIGRGLGTQIRQTRSR